VLAAFGRQAIAWPTYTVAIDPMATNAGANTMDSRMRIVAPVLRAADPYTDR